MEAVAALHVALCMSTGVTDLGGRQTGDTKMSITIMYQFGHFDIDALIIYMLPKMETSRNKAKPQPRSSQILSNQIFDS